MQGKYALCLHVCNIFIVTPNMTAIYLRFIKGTLFKVFQWWANDSYVYNLP